MARDGIRIVEFGEDGEELPAAGTAAGPGNEAGMKIVEFGNDPGESRAAVATAESIGPVKIVEFDDDGPSGPAPPREAPRAAQKAIKIRDFGAEDEAGRERGTGAGPNIKVVEFDW